MSQLSLSLSGMAGAPAETNPSDTNQQQELNTVLEQGNRANAAEDQAHAYTLYRRATELAPNNTAAWAGRAATATLPDDALLSWAYACALAPADQAAAAAFDKRIEEKIAASNVAQTASLLLLGRAVAEVGQKPAAYRLFKRATELDEENQDAWIWRAGLTQDIEETITCLKRVLTLNPGNTQAKAGLEWALSKHPPSPPPLSSSAETAVKLMAAGRELLPQGARTRAHTLFVRATEIDPANEDAWLWRSSTTPDVDEALTCIDKALAINPENRSAREARSWLRVKKLRESMHPRPVPSPAPEKAPGAPHTAPATRTHATRNKLVVALTALAALLLALIYMLFRLAA